MSEFSSNPKNNTKISIALSGILRHKAAKMGIPISTDGYVNTRDILRHQTFRGCNLDTLKSITANCAKQRFEMKNEDGHDYIRARQGHSISKVTEDDLLTRVLDPAELPLCIHGTKREFVTSIQQNGLNRMKRNHIHMASGLVGENGVISGLRYNCEIIVTIDARAAMDAGIPFFLSGNGVVLSPGLIDTGVIPPQFLTAYDNMESFKNKRNHKQEDIMMMNQTLKVDSFPLYYCVVDFEATCERGNIKNQEIIEFPAVFINSLTLNVEFEFHAYVKPIFNPVLSSFCTSLTGIEQSTVANADEFPVVLNNFLSFLSEHQFDVTDDWENCQYLEGKKKVIFISHGSWDFKTMLPQQCALSKVSVPNQMRYWVNAKDVIKQIYPKAKRLGMSDVLKMMNLELVGKHHSGIDDSRNIARYLINLCHKGAKIEKWTA